MKKIILALLLISFTSELSAQIELLNIDFQSGIPSNFTLLDADQNIPNSQVSEFTSPWISYTDPDSSANKVAASTSFFTTEDTASRWLITPALQLGAFGNFISWNAKSHDPSFPDDYVVLLSTTGNLPADFTDTIGSVEQENFEWTNREVNLSLEGFNSQQIYIAFVNRTYDGFKLYIDDIKVRKEDPVSVGEIADLRFKVYPNPFQNQLTIESDEAIDKIRLFSVNGTLLLETSDKNLDLTHFEKGYYLVQITGGSKIATQKVLKF
jgi:hypothetical protein